MWLDRLTSKELIVHDLLASLGGVREQEEILYAYYLTLQNSRHLGDTSLIYV